MHQKQFLNISEAFRKLLDISDNFRRKLDPTWIELD